MVMWLSNEQMKEYMPRCRGVLPTEYPCRDDGRYGDHQLGEKQFCLCSGSPPGEEPSVWYMYIYATTVGCSVEYGVGWGMGAPGAQRYNWDEAEGGN